MHPDPTSEALQAPARLLTARQVADRLGVSAETVLRWTRRGQLPAFRLPGGALRYRDVDLAVWFAEKATSRPRPVGEAAAGARNLTEAADNERRKGDSRAADSTSVRMIERHYGALLDRAAAGIAGRLDAFEAEQDEATIDRSESV